MKKLKIIIGIIAFIMIVFLLVNEGYKKAGDKKEDTLTAPSAILEVKATDWTLGPVDAKVTLVEYLDFECEACGAYYPLTSKLKEEYKDSMRFVIRYFPLPGHKNSRTAAYAAEAAGKQGKFWEMYNILFTKQSEWGEQQVVNQDQFEQYAVEAGVNIDQWKKDVASDEVMNRVEDSYQEALNLKLEGTPVFFINGKMIESPRGYEEFKKLIDKALESQ